MNNNSINFYLPHHSQGSVWPKKANKPQLNAYYKYLLHHFDKSHDSFYKREHIEAHASYKNICLMCNQICTCTEQTVGLSRVHTLSQLWLAPEYHWTVSNPILMDLAQTDQASSRHWFGDRLLGSGSIRHLLREEACLAQLLLSLHNPDTSST